MSLTNEQVKELNRLNDLYRRFDSKIDDAHKDEEELVHQFQMEEFPMVSEDRPQMGKLGEMRKELLADRKQDAFNTVRREGDEQLSLD